MLLTARCALVLGLGLLGLSPVQAKTPFDGAWAVTIMTQRGGCDPAFRYAVLVTNGNITADVRESGNMVAISGKVDGKGQVRVKLSYGEQGASASGRLSASAGSGTWSGRSPSATCSGRWEARRND